MDDHGAPTSFLALDEGTPVLSADGVQIGTVEHVLADAETDIFDGLVIDTELGPGGHRFVDAEIVDAIHERAVILTLDTGACERLPRPSENPAVMDVDSADDGGSEMQRKLRRAWDRISGNY